MATVHADLIRTDRDDIPIDQRDGRFEFVHGRFEEKPSMGAEANRIATILVRKLDVFASEHRAGICFTQECGYQIFAHEPRRVRYPDGSFIRSGRLPEEGLPRGHFDLVPDIVIEVVSPNDLAEILDERITDYLLAGVPLIWVVYPLTRHVVVFRNDGSGGWIGPEGVLEGEEVLPDFSCPLRELFAVIDGDPGPSA